MAALDVPQQQIGEHYAATPSPAPSSVGSKEKLDIVPAAQPEAAPEAVTTEEPSSFNPGWRFYLAFSSLSIITLMVALDATSLSVALPIMSKLLGGSAIEAFWSGTSFLLTSTVFQPVIGSFSHIFGRKPLILFSLVLFAVGAIVAAVANDFGVILVGRSIQGVGGGGIMVLTEIVVTDLVPLRERPKWFSFISSMWAVGTVTGPMLGGGFAQNVSWRWIFWINLPFIGIGSLFIILFLNLGFRTSSFMTKLLRIDYIGSVLFLASATGFLIPITWGGVVYDWDSWRTLVPLIVCGVGLIVFVIHQEYVASEPLIRTAVFKNRTAASSYLQVVLHGCILWSLLYYLPLYYQGVKGYSAIVSGVASFPQTFTVAPASIVVGIAITVTGKFRWALWVGWVLTAVGMGILMLLDVDTSIAAWIFLNLISGLGTGMLFPPMTIAVQAAASAADQGYAATMFALLRSFGQTLGVAFGGVIFQNQMRKKLLKSSVAAMASEYSRNAAGLVEIIKAMPDNNPVKLELQESYVYALKYVWLFMCVLSVIGLALVIFVQPLSLDATLETEQGFQHETKVKDAEKNDS